MFGPPAILNAPGVFGALQFPWVAVAQPVVGLFHLAAVLDVLAEHAVFVADAIAHDRQLQRRTAIQETGGQAAQSAIAQAGILLVVDQFLDIEAQALQGHLARLAQTQVEQSVGKAASHQEFERQIIGVLGVLLFIGVAGALVALHQAVAHRQHEGAVGIMRRAAMFVAPQEAGKIAPHIQGQRFVVHLQRRQFVEQGRGLAVFKRLHPRRCMIHRLTTPSDNHWRALHAQSSPKGPRREAAGKTHSTSPPVCRLQISVTTFYCRFPPPGRAANIALSFHFRPSAS